MAIAKAESDSDIENNSQSSAGISPSNIDLVSIIINSGYILNNNWFYITK